MRTFTNILLIISCRSFANVPEASQPQQPQHPAAPQPSLKEQIKEAARVHGPLFAGLWIAISLLDLAVIYALLRLGLDVQALLGRWGIDVGTVGASSSTFLLAYAIHKSITPIRVPAQIALITFFISRFHRARTRTPSHHC